jgi:hypothetical protein
MTVSLSNTLGKSDNSNGNESSTSQGNRPADNNYGIDTVALYFPVDIEQCDHTSDLWEYEGARNRQKAETEGGSLVANFICGYANVRVNLYLDSSRCRLEFNAARVLSPKSQQLLHPDALSRVVEVVLEQLAGIVHPSFDTFHDSGEIVRLTDWQGLVNITRLDVARDFVVSNPCAVRLGLAQVHSKYQKTHKVTTSPNDGWSIECGTKYEGKDIFYDKEAELRQHQVDTSRPDNAVIYRFEAVLKKSRLANSGMKTLDQVTDERAWEAIQGRWQKTGWSSPLPSSTGLLEAVSHLSQTRMDGLLGYLHRRAAGQEATIPAPYMREKNKLAKTCGLTPGLPVELLGKPTTYLDIHSGKIKSLSPVPPI